LTNNYNTILVFPFRNDRAKFHRIRFKIATAGAMTDRCRRSYNLSHACYANWYSNGTCMSGN